MNRSLWELRHEQELASQEDLVLYRREQVKLSEASIARLEADYRAIEDSLASAVGSSHEDQFRQALALRDRQIDDAYLEKECREAELSEAEKSLETLAGYTYQDALSDFFYEEWKQSRGV